MTRYASTTEVPVERTRAEIETTVRRYGADGYVSGWEGDKAMVQFRASGRYVRLVTELPDRQDNAFTTYRRGSSTFRRAEAEALKFWEQACRQRWRAMLLLIKAKLEAVESGIVTFEQEFFPHVVMPDGSTVYQYARDRVEIAYTEGKMPPLLPSLGSDKP